MHGIIPTSLRTGSVALITAFALIVLINGPVSGERIAEVPHSLLWDALRLVNLRNLRFSPYSPLPEGLHRS
jgi:hypothetical protein